MLVSVAINECDQTFLCPMKKSSLALVSSPALLATFLVSGNPAFANTNSVSSSTNKAPDTYTESVVITKTTVETNNQFLSDRNDRANVLTSDRVGDLAISKLGCDCKGCRQVVLSLFSK
ncbi:hypothetical protein ABRG53_2749 [Pseudanabaena sp. ABRG5-3]|nr:hypothetical protein ABRG53_2749 [Pseudanabaena sp. ABRG5-3]